MLKKLIERIKERTSPKIIDPAQFDDPVAQKTEWVPLKPGGANFRTHKLVKASLNRIEFRVSLGAKLFAAIFFLFGVAGIIFGASYLLSPEKLSEEGIGGPILGIAVGCIFIAVGGALFYSMLRPIVFDKASGYFWRGWRGPDQVINKESIKDLTPLGRIHALQLISEYCSRSRSSYYSYELNLVLEDASRVNVIDHGNLQKIREDANTLSEFLGYPVWDAC